MDDQDIFDELVTVLKTYARNHDALEKATTETSIIHDLKVTSVRLVDVINRCEDRFGIRIDDEDIAKRLGKMGDAVDLIRSKM